MPKKKILNKKESNNKDIKEGGNLPNYRRRRTVRRTISRSRRAPIRRRSTTRRRAPRRRSRRRKSFSKRTVKKFWG